MSSGRFFVFTVVRHPVDRVVSAYRNAIMWDKCGGMALEHVPKMFEEIRKA